MITFVELKQKISSHPFFSSPFYLKHRQFMVPGAVLVIALLISGLVTVPQFLRLFETYKSIDELNQKKAFFIEKNAKLSAIDIELYRKNLDTALKALPVDKNIPGVTGELLVALSSSGLTLGGISLSNSPAESDKVQEYTLIFEVSGQEDSLKNFLERVKLTPRIIKMTAIDVGKGRTSIVNASITFVTLYQSLPANIGSVEDRVPELTAADNQVLANIEEKAKFIPAVTNNSDAQPVSGKVNPFAR